MESHWLLCWKEGRYMSLDDLKAAPAGSLTLYGLALLGCSLIGGTPWENVIGQALRSGVEGLLFTLARYETVKGQQIAEQLGEKGLN